MKNIRQKPNMASQPPHQQTLPSQNFSSSSTPSSSNQLGILLQNKKRPKNFPPPNKNNSHSSSDSSRSPSPEMADIDALEAALHSLSLRPQPYECTRSCGDSFAASSPWKRHENASHPAPEVWRCDIPTPLSPNASGHCSNISYSIASFVAHLQSAHGVAEDDLSDEDIEASRIGGSYQGNFWCGFCVTRIRLAERGRDALDERFAHLIAHFIDGMRVVDHWVGLDIPL